MCHESSSEHLPNRRIVDGTLNPSSKLAFSSIPFTSHFPPAFHTSRAQSTSYTHDSSSIFPPFTFLLQFPTRSHDEIRKYPYGCFSMDIRFSFLFQPVLQAALPGLYTLDAWSFVVFLPFDSLGTKTYTPNLIFFFSIFVSVVLGWR